MLAVCLSQFGPPTAMVAARVPAPTPGRGQAMIEVAFANITFVETQLRAGAGPFQMKLPTIPGNGVGGRVVAVGPGVDSGFVGRRVIASTGGSGGYAELVTVDAASMIEVPGQLPLDTAVALLADGRTAAMLVEAARLRAGDQVLVEAAAGGVGVLLVQLARNAGATVVAAVGSATKVDVARRFGADIVVNYREAGWGERVRGQTGPLSVVFDGVGGAVARTAFGLLDHGGRMLSFGAASGEWAAIPDETAAARGIELLSLPRPTPEQMRTSTEYALAEGVAGRLVPLIGQRFALQQAAEAHSLIESRASIGKTLLVVHRP